MKILGTSEGVGYLLMLGDVVDKTRYLRDPVHNYIQMEPNEIRLIDNFLFQRLRGIHQQGTAYLTYPSATHTRFEHSLGVMSLTTHVLNTLIKKHPDVFSLDLGNNKSFLIDKAIRSLARIVSLWHDVCHGPFSHVSERTMAYFIPKDEYEKFVKGKRPVHEYLTYKALKEILPRYLDAFWRGDSWVKNFIAENAHRMFFKHPLEVTVEKYKRSLPFDFLSQIIDGPSDVDKIDSLLRDTRSSGTEFGHFDIERLIRGASILNNQLVFEGQALSAAESLVVERYKVYRWIHFHHTICFTDELMSRIIEMATLNNILEPYYFEYKYFEDLADIDLKEGDAPKIYPTIVDDQFIVNKVRGIKDGKEEHSHILQRYLGMLERRRFFKPLWKVTSHFEDAEARVLFDLVNRLETQMMDRVEPEKRITNQIEEDLSEKLGINDRFSVLVAFKPYKPVKPEIEFRIQLFGVEKTEFLYRLSATLYGIMMTKVGLELLRAPPLYIPIYVYLPSKFIPNEAERKKAYDKTMEVISKYTK